MNEVSGCSKPQKTCCWSNVGVLKTYNNYIVNPSSPKGVATTKQFSPWCSKSRSQGVKFLRVNSSSSFTFILAKKKIEPTTYTGGRVSFQSWEVRGGWCDPMIFKLDYFENIWSKMHSKICLEKKKWKSRVFTIFYVKIIFCLYFRHKMAISQFSSARSHYNVIVRSIINGWYLFWYQWKEDIHTYTLVVNLGLYDLQYW